MNHNAKRTYLGAAPDSSPRLPSARALRVEPPTTDSVASKRGLGFKA